MANNTGLSQELYEARVTYLRTGVYPDANRNIEDVSPSDLMKRLSQRQADPALKELGDRLLLILAEKELPEVVHIPTPDGKIKTMIQVRNSYAGIANAVADPLSERNRANMEYLAALATLTFTTLSI